MRISLRKTFGRALILAGALTLACWGYLFIEELWLQRTAVHVLEQQMLHASAVLGRGGTSRNQILAQPCPGNHLALCAALILANPAAEMPRLGAIETTLWPLVRAHRAHLGGCDFCSVQRHSFCEVRVSRLYSIPSVAVIAGIQSVRRVVRQLDFNSNAIELREMYRKLALGPPRVLF